MTIVDIHCHTFNGDDLPVEGFVDRVLLHNPGTRRLVSKVLDLVGQIGTPGYEAERARLDRLLGQDPYGIAAMAFVEDPPLDDVVAETFERLKLEDPALLAQADIELRTSSETPIGPAAFSFVDGYQAAKRAIAWAVLLRRSRLDITRQLVTTYPEVDLFTPLLVDLGAGLQDAPEVPPLLQLELQEKISRLSMLGRLERDSHGHLHPFVGFDPRSELRSRQTKDVITPMEVVQMAVHRYGFVGVKLYPPMGFRPIANADPEVDAILEEFYSWCEDEDVPVTVHCNDSNQANNAYRLFSDPKLWARVLDQHGRLRLNLGHFGGARKDEDPTDPASAWPAQIASLAKGHPHLFADTGDHGIDDDQLADAYLARLIAMFRAGTPTAEMASRLMYGSDWYMLALLPKSGEFLKEYRSRYVAKFGDDAGARFMGAAALDFLGFSEAGNNNRARLVARYQRFELRPPAWLVSSSSGAGAGSLA
jgi:hypothetical protein